jgi:hypothetical protein
MDSVRGAQLKPARQERLLARERRVATITIATVAAWTLAGLFVDRYLDLRGQVFLGVFTCAVLAALLWLHEPAARLQALAVVAIASLGEVIGSLVWGVYSYRLHDLPAFVPPGHGLVYLGGMALATLAGRRFDSLLLGCAAVGAAAWGVAGMTVLPRLDVSGAIGCTFLLVVLVWTRRPVYAGVFLVVAGLELYGTALGTWTWQAAVPGLRLPQGNPPSGAASGYVVFDVLALALLAQLVRAARMRPFAAWRRIAFSR